MKKIVRVSWLCLFLLVLIITVFHTNFKKNIVDVDTPRTDNNLIKENDCDINVLPDKYNTGAVEPSNGFINIPEDTMVLNDVFFMNSKGGYRLELYNKNKTISGKIIFENVDFKNNLTDYTSTSIKDREIELIFNNCKFGEITTPAGDSNVHYEFNNCTINHFAGSNSTFNNCRFGDSYRDGINPYNDVTVNSCYIVNLSTDINSESEYHTDGSQIFGRKDVLAKNIKFYNCRYEMPQLAYENSRINACFMLQLEFSDGKGISFDNCKLNGGGFAIYCRALKGFSFSDVNISNIKIGAANRFGFFYKDISEGANIDYDSVISTPNLYVGTVYKENGSIYMSVTNDTNQNRTLRVYTSNGKKYDYEISACPTYPEIGNMKFEEFPFDKLVKISEDSDWIVCCDVVDGNEEQIRYVNWTDEDVYLSLNKSNYESNDDNEKAIIDSGKCGKNVEYKLYMDGELCLSGEGETKNYNSSVKAPWYDYKEQITDINIEEGIETIGNQLFRNCGNVNEIILPNGVTEVGANSFMGCTSLEKIEIPVTIEQIGKYAFWNTDLSDIVYNGTNEEFSKIKINGCNPNYLKDYEVPEVEVIDSGKCGTDVKWVLYSNGKLILEGEGATYDFNSSKNAPWINKYEDKITYVEIGINITRIGNQIFRNCNNIKQIKLGESLSEIGTNAFIKCSSLEEITIPDSVTSIENFAFKSSGLRVIRYVGDSEKWEKIAVGSNAFPNDIEIRCNR